MFCPQSKFFLGYISGASCCNSWEQTIIKLFSWLKVTLLNLALWCQTSSLPVEGRVCPLGLMRGDSKPKQQRKLFLALCSRCFFLLSPARAPLPLGRQRVTCRRWNPLHNFSSTLRAGLCSPEETSAQPGWSLAKPPQPHLLPSSAEPPGSAEQPLSQSQCWAPWCLIWACRW